jgi:hypothetical protein
MASTTSFLPTAECDLITSIILAQPETLSQLHIIYFLCQSGVLDLHNVVKAMVKMLILYFLISFYEMNISISK